MRRVSSLLTLHPVPSCTRTPGPSQVECAAGSGGHPQGILTGAHGGQHRGPLQVEAHIRPKGETALAECTAHVTHTCVYAVWRLYVQPGVKSISNSLARKIHKVDCSRHRLMLTLVMEDGTHVSALRVAILMSASASA